MIAEMVLGYETSKLLVMQAAWLKDKGVRNTRETSLPSGMRPSRLSARRTSPSRCTAPTGTPPSTGSSATSATRAPIIYEGDPDPQDDAGRARPRVPQPERARRRHLPLASWGPALLALAAAGCVALALAPAAYAPPRAGTFVPGESLGEVGSG